MHIRFMFFCLLFLISLPVEKWVLLKLLQLYCHELLNYVDSHIIQEILKSLILLSIKVANVFFLPCEIMTIAN